MASTLAPAPPAGHTQNVGWRPRGGGEHTGDRSIQLWPGIGHDPSSLRRQASRRESSWLFPNPGGALLMTETSKSRPITRGDVEAVLHAFGGGGQAVLLHSKIAQGAPADVLGSHGSIRPFAGSPWDGAHFCAEDWHVIVIADIEGGDASFTHADAEAIMNELNVSLTLDGTPLPTT